MRRRRRKIKFDYGDMFTKPALSGGIDTSALTNMNVGTPAGLQQGASPFYTPSNLNTIAKPPERQGMSREQKGALIGAAGQLVGSAIESKQQFKETEFTEDLQKSRKEAKAALYGIGTAASAVNPIVGGAIIAGTAIGSAIGSQTQGEWGQYKSRSGNAIDEMVNPVTGYQGIKRALQGKQTASGAVNKLTLGLFGKSDNQKDAEKGKRAYEAKRIRNIKENSQQKLANYNTSGISDYNTMLAMGGFLPKYTKRGKRRYAQGDLIGKPEPRTSTDPLEDEELGDPNKANSPYYSPENLNAIVEAVKPQPQANPPPGQVPPKQSWFNTPKGQVAGGAAMAASNLLPQYNNPNQTAGEKATDQAGVQIAGAIGPWWGALAKVGTTASSHIRKDDTGSHARGFIGDTVNPFHQFNSLQEGKGKEQTAAFLNPVMASHLAADRRKQAALSKKRLEMVERQKIGQQKLANYNVNGNIYAKYGTQFPMGGDLPTPTDQGQGEQLASNMAQYHGPSHSNGGIELDTDQNAQPDIEVEGTEVIKDNMVYSNRLRPSKDVKNVIRASGVSVKRGDTYATLSARIGKKKGKFEEQMNSTRAGEKNSAQIMQGRLDETANLLFMDQQARKFKKGTNGKYSKGGTLPKFPNGNPPDTTGLYKNPYRNKTVQELRSYRMGTINYKLAHPDDDSTSKKFVDKDLARLNQALEYKTNPPKKSLKPESVDFLKDQAARYGSNYRKFKFGETPEGVSQEVYDAMRAVGKYTNPIFKGEFLRKEKRRAMYDASPEFKNGGSIKPDPKKKAVASTPRVYTDINPKTTNEQKDIQALANMKSILSNWRTSNFQPGIRTEIDQNSQSTTPRMRVRTKAELENLRTVYGANKDYLTDRRMDLAGQYKANPNDPEIRKQLMGISEPVEPGNLSMKLDALTAAAPEVSNYYTDWQPQLAKDFDEAHQAYGGKFPYGGYTAPGSEILPPRRRGRTVQATNVTPPPVFPPAVNAPVIPNAPIAPYSTPGQAPPPFSFEDETRRLESLRTTPTFPKGGLIGPVQEPLVDPRTLYGKYNPAVSPQSQIPLVRSNRKKAIGMQTAILDNKMNLSQMHPDTRFVTDSTANASQNFLMKHDPAYVDAMKDVKRGPLLPIQAYGGYTKRLHKMNDALKTRAFGGYLPAFAVGGEDDEEEPYQSRKSVWGKTAPPVYPDLSTRTTPYAITPTKANLNPSTAPLKVLPPVKTPAGLTGGMQGLLDARQQRITDKALKKKIGTRGFDVSDYKGDIAAGLGTIANQIMINKLETKFDPETIAPPRNPYTDRRDALTHQANEQYRTATQGIEGSDAQGNLALRSNMYAKSLGNLNQQLDQEQQREDAMSGRHAELKNRTDIYNTQFKNQAKMLSMENRNQKRALTQQNIDNLIKSYQGNETVRSFTKTEQGKNLLAALQSGDRGTSERLLESLSPEMRKQIGLKYEANGGVFKKGGIYIKPKNRGKFNALKKRTGKTTEQLKHSKNPLTRKRATFAANAKKWKH